MNSKKQLFYDKIQCIYNIISKKDLDNFTNLFYIESNKTTFKNRKSYLRKNWLKRQEKPINPRMFKSEYFDYPFSGLSINGKRLFEGAEEFLQIDIEPFCQRIKNYIALQVELKIDKENNYRYLYIYNINGVEDNPNIDYFEIDYIESTTSNEILIEVKPPQHKLSLVIEPYHGKLRYQGSKIILSFENSDDYISAIFNTELMSTRSKYLVGVGIGIADINQKIPVAKKVILTKKRIEDINSIYPTLNETEMISAEENSYKLKHNDEDFNLSHLEKYVEKINRVDILFDKLSTQQQYSSFYEQLAFKEFLATTNIFKKIKEKQPYYINYRKRIIDVLLKSYTYEKYKKIYMVMPIYYEDNPLAQESFKALQLQDELLALSDRVAIEIIFVAKSCQEPLNEQFKRFLSKVKQQITVWFVSKRSIENEVNSIDFIFTDNKNFVITKFLRVDTPVFNIYQDKSTISEHESIFRKILNRSISYNTFTENPHQLCANIATPLLKTLTGEWHFYVYGSKKLWEDRVVIFQDGRVDYFSENIKTESGVIVHREYQSVILLDDMVSKRLFTLIFDHQPHKISKAFIPKVIGKKYKSEEDILTVGILSKEPIEIEKVHEILGDMDDVQMLEGGIVEGRLADYLVETYGY